MYICTYENTSGKREKGRPKTCILGDTQYEKTCLQLICLAEGIQELIILSLQLMYKFEIFPK